LGTLLGKILRIDPRPSGAQPYTVPADNPFVGVAGARPEIWAYGLRNPWRFSFDSATGDLWIGDVGQDTEEEIDLARATRGRDAGKGENFGWNRMEGNDHLNDPVPDDVVAPVITHTHDDGWLAIIGGYVYRGALKGLRGVYLYSDYYKGDIRGARRTRGGATDLDLGISAANVSAFGEGPDHALYVLSQSDGISKVVRAKSGS
jgi:glucose/arabinose dehydrogenase